MAKLYASMLFIMAFMVASIVAQDDWDKGKKANCTYNDIYEENICNDYGFGIARSYYCDGSEDCANGHDEPMHGKFACNNTEAHKCEPSVQFDCRNAYGQCVPLSYKCNGEVECIGGEDELYCTSNPGDKCPSTKWFKCTGGGCIPLYQRCDCAFDCPDESDEEGCLPYPWPQGIEAWLNADPNDNA